VNVGKIVFFHIPVQLRKEFLWQVEKELGSNLRKCGTCSHGWPLTFAMTVPAHSRETCA
jgi:hypothetical protein